MADFVSRLWLVFGDFGQSYLKMNKL